MTNKEIMEYALKGLSSDIYALDMSITKGQYVLFNRSNGDFSDKMSMNDDQIREVITTNRELLKKAMKNKSDLEWDLYSQI